MLSSVLQDDSALKEGDLYIRSVCFSPDGMYLATGAEDKKIRVCKLDDSVLDQMMLNSTFLGLGYYQQTCTTMFYRP